MQYTTLYGKRKIKNFYYQKVLLSTFGVDS